MKVECGFNFINDQLTKKAVLEFEQCQQMNIESATGTFVFTFILEKYVKENIFQTLNAFFLITHAFLWKMLLNRPPIIGPLFGGVY